MSASYLLRPHQKRALLSDKRHVAMFGGIGSGKTDVSASWVIMKVVEADAWPRGMAQGIIAANTYPQLFDSTLRRMFNNWHGLGIPFEPSELPRTHRPLTVRIGHLGQWREILCRSLERPETLAGVEVGWLDIDEAWGTVIETVDLLNGRVRATAQPNNQTLYTTTLDDFDSWMHQMFVEDFDEARMECIYARTHDNAPNLPPGYIAELRAAYDDALYRRMVLAQWVSLLRGSIYRSFDRDAHVDTRAEFDKKLPVHWWHDFNIAVGKPMSSVLAHFRMGRTPLRPADYQPREGESEDDPGGVPRPEVHIFDEIVIPDAGTEDVAIEAKGGKYADAVPIAKWTISGDAAGRARSPSSKRSDYDVLYQHGFTRQNVPASNPPIKTRHNTFNTMLKAASGDVRIVIHPRCRTLIKGLETGKLKTGARLVEVETYQQHVTTAAGYGIAQHMAIKAKKRKRRRLVSV